MTSELAGWLLHSVLALSAGIGVVLLLRRGFRRCFGARLGYALWLLPPAAMSAAWLPALPGDAVPVSILGGFAAVAAMPAAATAGQASSLDALSWGLLLWATGVVAVAVLMVRRHRRFVRQLGVLQPLGGGHFASDAVDGLPALVGLLRPRIVVPADFEHRYSPLERELMFEHERNHLRRGDLWSNALLALLQCVFWFNPLLHLAAGRFRHDQELACDAAVLARHPGAARRYGEAMLKTRLLAGGVPLACHWGRTHPLKERIRMLTFPAVSPRRFLAGAVLLAAAIATTATAAWATQPVDTGAAPPEPSSAAGPSYNRMSAPGQAIDATGSPLTGTVVLDVLVGTDGAPLEVEIARSSGHEALDVAAATAVQGWLFNPAVRDGEPATARVRVPIRFEAGGDSAPAVTVEGALDTLTIRSGE